MHSTCCVQYITRSIILSYARLSHNIISTSRSLSENFDFQEARAASLPWKTLYTISRHQILPPFDTQAGLCNWYPVTVSAQYAGL